MEHRHTTSTAAPPVRVVAWELTRACNLSCPYCRAEAGVAGPDELGTKAAFGILEEICALGRPIVILSGGEPLLRRDVFDIAARATSLGLPVALATNGTLVDDAVAARIRESGVRRASVSLDFPDAARHDAVRGEGTFNRAIGGIEALKRAGVGFQVNVTVGAANAALLGEMLDLAVGLGAEAFHLFFIVDVGRAAQCQAGLAIEDYEGVLERIVEIERRSPIEVKVTCAPQYERVRKAAGLSDEGRRVTRGCLAGCGFLFISAVGEIKPCGYFDHVLAYAGRRALAEVWEANPVLAALRAFDSLGGGCGRCRNNRVCGGCRARALSTTGDYLNADPACPYNRLP